MCLEDHAAFLRQFFRATVFLCRFFQFTDAFFGSILPIFANFCGILCQYFLQKSNSVLGIKFSLCTIDP